MTAVVLTLRPRPRPRAVPSPSASSPVPPVEWNGVRGLAVARCPHCPDAFESPDGGQVEDWATDHRCDPELLALLDHLTRRRAA